MKERPILFSGEMVKAILAGRKTQTRRIMKPQPINPNYSGKMEHTTSHCPYGQPGDRLWVRETWKPLDGRILYLATPGIEGADERAQLRHTPLGKSDGWKPSIHMPRWASRLTLEIIGVRVQRLQEITEADALKEGIGHPITRDCKRPQFARLWDEINGKRASWASNPWVWVIEFKRATNS